MSEPVNWKEHGTHLVPIGGGAIPKPLGQAMINLSGASDPLITIIAASSRNAAERIRVLFDELPVKLEVVSLHQIQNDDPSALALLETADIIFFAGGNQNEIARSLLDTESEDMIFQRLSEGVVLSGTSAGASIMGTIMPCGGTGWGALRYGGIDISQAENIDDDITPKPVIVGEGIGFMPEIIFDQHFMARARFGRLLYLVSRYREREVIGVGIDESTGAIIDWNSDQMVAVGEGSVAVVTASRFDHDNSNEYGPLTSFGLNLDILNHGHGYNLKRKEPILREDAQQLVAATRQ